MARLFQCIVVMLFLPPVLLMGQVTRLDIEFDKSAYMPNDTITIAATLIVKGELPGVGTLYIKAINDEGRVWNLRWPILNGMFEGDLIIPDSFPPSNMTFYFAGTQNFFKVYGRIKNSGKIDSLKATLFTSGNDFLQENILVGKGKDFLYTNKVFEDEATLSLQLLKGKNDELDIEIITPLDSTYEIIASAVREIQIGNPRKKTTPSPNVQSVDSVFTSKEKMLATVVVTAKKQSRGEAFDEKFSTGLFQSLNERVLDLIDDKTVFGYTSILDYLNGRVAGLRITNVGPTPTATWRSAPVYFYLDEFLTDIEALKSFPPSQVAIIKAYPPPFFGNSFGAGAAIAIYSRRDGYYSDGKKHSFRIKGYTSAVSVLPVNPR
ncbi:MAG: hypothetical protein H7Y31_02585 [Chitinophagaceae bacterium]|nr:hypothetical protein [Chitinophagaceae bacterium]